MNPRALLHRQGHRWDDSLTTLRLVRLATGDTKSANAKGGRPGDDRDAPPPVGIELRAYPLIQLLSASAQKKSRKKGSKGTWRFHFHPPRR